MLAEAELRVRERAAQREMERTRQKSESTNEFQLIATTDVNGTCMHVTHHAEPHRHGHAVPAARTR